MEIIVSATVLCLAVTGSLTALVSLNRNAAATRLLTNARAVVQRNVDTALTVPYASGTNSTIPPILAITSASGATYSDDNAAPAVNIDLAGAQGTPLVTGTLTRTVTAVSNSLNATILQITFAINYTYRSRNYSYQVTTMRAPDE